MNLEDKSTEFKRAVHALSYALLLEQDIEDESEKGLFAELLEEVGFNGDSETLFESLSKNFKDYEDYSQLQEGHFTGVWFQQMQKENGDIFLRDTIGNELNMPRPLGSFVDIIEEKIVGEYTAKQISCFFVPFNTPTKETQFPLDETNHIPLSLDQIQHNGTHNKIAMRTFEYAKKLHTSSIVDSEESKN